MGGDVARADDADTDLSVSSHVPRSGMLHQARAHMSRSHVAISMCHGEYHATVCATHQSRARSRSRPSSDASRFRRCRTLLRPTHSLKDLTTGAYPYTPPPTSGLG